MINGWKYKLKLKHYTVGIIIIRKVNILIKMIKTILILNDILYLSKQFIKINEWANLLYNRSVNFNSNHHL